MTDVHCDVHCGVVWSGVKWRQDLHLLVYLDLVRQTVLPRPDDPHGGDAHVQVEHRCTINGTDRDVRTPYVCAFARAVGGGMGPKVAGSSGYVSEHSLCRFERRRLSLTWSLVYLV